MKNILILVAYVVAIICKVLLPKRMPTYIATSTGWEFIGWSWEYPRYKLWMVLSLSLLGVMQLS